MCETKSSYSLSDSPRFLRIWWFWFSFFDCAKSTIPCTDFAEDHEGSSAFCKAIHLVWAAGALAHRIKPEFFKDGPHIGENAC